MYNDDDDGSGAAAVSTDTADIYPVSEDFTGGIGAGWTIVDGYTDGETWRAANEGEYSTKPNWDETLTGEFFIVDSDFTPPANMDEQLITPTFDCSSYGTVTLSFRHQFVYNAGEYGDVDIKVDGGGWQNILRYQSSTSGDVEVDITAIAAGHSAVQVRWYYHNAYYDWYWGIDNVLIAGVSESVSVKGDLEPDCDVDFADFARFGQGWLSTEGGSNWNEACNLAEPGDTVINALDLAVLVQNWLSQP